MRTSASRHSRWAPTTGLLIEAVLARAQPLPGDVYALERDTAGRHGSIMKYNLNSEGEASASQEAAPQNQ